MDGVFFAHIFYAKVVYNEGEHDGTPFVTPKTWSAFALVVAFLVQAFGQEFLSKNARLGQAVDAFADFEVDPIIVDMVQKIVFVDKFLWDV